MGLCLWYLAFVWMRNWRTHALASFLLIPAWIAHPFPVIWALGIVAYAICARPLSKRGRMLVFLLGISFLFALHYFLTLRYRYEWSGQQVVFVTGTNQLSLFGPEFMIPLAALLFIWLRQLRNLMRERGSSVAGEIPLQLWLLNAVAVALVPNQILFPQFDRQFGYITTRLSLGAAILLCTALASAPVDKFTKFSLAITAIAFFVLLYRSEQSLNHLENRLDAAIGDMPAMQRVIAEIPIRSLRWLCFQQDLDRACIGRCFSYGNYEPSSGQFRVRALPNNGVVLSDHNDADAVRTGKYIVRASDLPLDLVFPCGAGYHDVCSRSLRAGQINGNP